MDLNFETVFYYIFFLEKYLKSAGLWSDWLGVSREPKIEVREVGAAEERKAAWMEEALGEEMVTPGEVVGRSSDVKAGRGTYAALHNNTVYASLTGFRRTIPPAPDSPDQVRF